VQVVSAETLLCKETQPPCLLLLPPQVNTEHILLGLIAEDSATSKAGYLNSGLTAERAKAVVESMSQKKRPITGGESIPFSREVRRTFEAATNVGPFFPMS
jgi:hypothetical protein